LDGLTLTGLGPFPAADIDAEREHRFRSVGMLHVPKVFGICWQRFDFRVFDTRGEEPKFEIYAQFPRVDRKTAAITKILACPSYHRRGIRESMTDRI
jgi:hypothetical protein